MNHAATATIALGKPTAGSKRMFARHYAEMVLAMFVGMAILGGLAELAFAAAGSDVSDQSGGFQVTLMGFNMTVAMVAWMGYRGHTRAQNAEMAASMVVPTLIAAGFAWAGVLSTAGGMAVQHVVMLPAMLAVMLWRYDEYSRHA